MRYRNEWVQASIIGAEKVAANVMQIKIMPEQGTHPFTVGSHIDFSVIVNELPEIRSYSLVGTYKENEPYTISVKRLLESRGGSKYMWTLKPGDKIKISQPTNHFELGYNTTDYLLIAGGIGITPLVGMAEELAKKENKTVRMIYIGVSTKEMPYIEHLQNLLGDNLILHTDDTLGRYNINEISSIVKESTQVYLCGPLGLMNAVRKFWESAGLGSSNLRFETFGASGLFAPQKFIVKLPRFNKEIEVPANQSLLKTIEQSGIEVMYDCLKGECGLCQVNILEYSGDIDHRDFFFSEDEKGENKKMCACVSRVANGNITIDTAYRGS